MRLFTDHPSTLGESYWEHQRFAAGIGFGMIGGGLACLLHAALPPLCETTGSRTLRRLQGKVADRAAAARAAGHARPAKLEELKLNPAAASARR